jgi:hypothetical protein
MSRIWKKFIPDEERHVFERGAYFAVDVIPDRLAVLSLNTLFWYDSNTCKSAAEIKCQSADEQWWMDVRITRMTLELCRWIGWRFN